MIPKSRSVSQTLDAHPFQRNVKWAITGSACSIPTVWSLETLCFYFLKHQASIKWELWLYSGSFLLVFLLSIDSSVSFWTLFTQQDLGPTAACVQQRWLRLKKKGINQIKFKSLDSDNRSMTRGPHAKVQDDGLAYWEARENIFCLESSAAPTVLG